MAPGLCGDVAAPASASASASASTCKTSWLAYDPETYDEQLRAKAAGIRSRFSAHLHDDTPFVVAASAPTHFRQRARFALRRFSASGELSEAESDPLSYALFDGGAPSVAVDSFPIASAAINELMPRLLAELNGSEALGGGAAACHFLSTQAGDMLVSLIYEKPLHADWAEAAQRRLRDGLGLPCVVGRAKGTHVALDRDWVTERIHLADGRRLTYRQVEGSFSNPSARMAEQTLDFLCEAAADAAAATGGAGGSAAGEPQRARPNLLELYCGNGHHTVALAKHFSRLLAVEIDRKLCAAAELNLSANGVRNASVLPVSSGAFCRRLLRKLKRAAAATEAGAGAAAAAGAAGADAAAPPGAADTAATASLEVESLEAAWMREAMERTDVVLVDPPRCGLDGDTLELVRMYEHILYISCNPTALLANLDSSLCETHEVARFAVFDHFPYTPHLECGVHLRRRRQ